MHNLEIITLNQMRVLASQEVPSNFRSKENTPYGLITLGLATAIIACYSIKRLYNCIYKKSNTVGQIR